MSDELLTQIYTKSPAEVWRYILDEIWVSFSEPIRSDIADAITTKRDRQSALFDDLLSGSAWELWSVFEDNSPQTSKALIEFWNKYSQGKAILILDALSLREVPWILEQAKQRGYTIEQQRPTTSELPGNTTPFAKAIGFGQRSVLADNRGKSTLFPEAWTEFSKMPFADCSGLVKADPNIIFWHEWPDSEMHDLAGENGYRSLAKSATQKLTSDDFWEFIDKLTTGRRLVITGDHGYAHSGLFSDITAKDQADYLKETFKSGRSIALKDTNKPHYWVPPLTQKISSQHGDWELVLGRKKWKSQGGYPSLTHGGLSLLEVVVPFIEISK